MIPRKQRLAITLFKGTVSSISECLKDYSSLRPISIRKDFNLQGEVFIGDQKSDEPSWVGFLRSGVDEEIRRLDNLSNRAVMIVKVQNRFMGISFGYGLVMFDGTKIERNFGLKVVINSVDPKSLRSCDSAKLDDNTILTRKQSSRSSSKSAFGVELPSELLCGVSGKCSEPVLGIQIDGKDQLLITPKISFLGLKNVLETALAQYAKKDYQKTFEWFDNIQVENDPEKCEQLCEILTKDLQAGRFDLFSLACPDIYDPEKMDGFSFTAKGDLYSDLDFDDFANYLKFSKSTSSIAANDFKLHKIWAKDTNEEEVEKWTAFDCLNYETELAGERYVLFKGDWYLINKSYLTGLNKYFEEKIIKISEPLSIVLEEHIIGDSENEYNKKIGTRSDCICLDQKNIILKGLDPVEPCDVFTGDREFLHIKKKYDSAALSHLFAQGKVSGELLKVNEEFRKALRKKIRDLGGGKISDDLVPLSKIKPEDFKIVFGVIDKKAGDDLKLPFFSLINFQSTGRYLEESLGFKIGITKIKCKAA